MLITTGIIILLTDKSNATVWEARYKAFGERTVLTNAIPNHFGFPGQVWDEEAGLWQNWFRDYDHRTGRYVEGDPIGLGGGVNAYTYVNGNSIKWIDILGLHAPGGPWHPPDGVSTGCTVFDDCSMLSNKMRLLKKMIASHIVWDITNATNRHAVEIADLENTYNKCVALHQKKCTDSSSSCGGECKQVIEVIGDAAGKILFFIITICTLGTATA